MSPHSLALIGFGNVGQALARLLLRKRADLEDRYDLSFQVTGIATMRHGIALDARGIDLEAALALAKAGESLSKMGGQAGVATTSEFIREVSADVLVENSPVNHQTGQPAVEYIRAALLRGMHVVTANKGPVVHAFRDLNELALRQKRRFLFESAVMDGAPIFSLFRGSLPGADLLGFHGILNSCTNLILGQMEAGASLAEATAHAQSIGIAETDPTADIDGWDAAIKVAALATVLMGFPLTPQEVDRTGIRSITPELIAEACQEGRRWKLVCRCSRHEGRLEARVAPEKVPPGSPLYAVEGTSSFVQFHLDVLPGLGIVETDPGPETTAYGLVADLINLARGI